VKFQKAKIVRCGDVLPSLANLRVLFIIALVWCQSFALTASYGGFVNSVLWILQPTAFAGLFCLLGFTLARSRARIDLRTFVLRRAKAMLPVFLIAVIGAALVLGPLVTTISTRRYLLDTRTWLYLLNLIGWPRFTLPSVFDYNNLSEQVNSPLWTTPFVLLVLAGIAVGGNSRTARLVPLVIIGLAIALAIGSQSFDLRSVTPLGFTSREFQFQLCESLIASQLGVLGWRYRERITLDRRIAALFAAIIVVLAFLGARRAVSMPVLGGAMAIPTAYLAVYFAAHRLPGRKLASRLQPMLLGVFLFSFPIQQIVTLYSRQGLSAWLNFALGLPAVFLLSGLIWAAMRRFAPRLAAAGMGDEAILAASTGGLASGQWNFADAIEDLRDGANRKLIALRWQLTEFWRASLFWAIFVGAVLSVFALTYFASIGDR
jgi:peptidoglycan/LPS O-acetylase OafA/YrhL